MYVVRYKTVKHQLYMGLRLKIKVQHDRPCINAFIKINESKSRNSRNKTIVDPFNKRYLNKNKALPFYKNHSLT
jgi:hypothetical protein